MSLLSAEQLQLLGTQPIPGEKPGGESARLEESFEFIAQEIAKLDSLTEAEPVRWREVSERAQSILGKESKDFLVACYLTRSLCEVDLLSGLTQGVQLSNDLATTFWDDAFPPKKRARGRSQAFEWLVEECRPLLDGYQPKVSDLEHIRALEDSVTTLDALLIEKMAENAPNLAEFKQIFRRYRQSLEAESQKKERQQGQLASHSNQSASPNPQSASLASAVSAAPSSVASDKELMAAYRSCQEVLRNVSQFLSNKNRLDPELFRINRFITWLGVTQIPPATNGKTQLRPVSKEKLALYAGLIQDQRWHDLIPEIEQSLVRAPFWLDGQRHVVTALEALGADDIAGVVKEGVKGFVTRLPEVVNHHFSDDSPFADEQTKTWISREVMVSTASVSSSNLVIDSSGISPLWQQAYIQAESLQKEKKTREALKVFQDGVSQSTSLREQSLWRFNQARFCFDAGLIDLALPILENLDAQLVLRGVEDWEPEITKRVLELLLRCYQMSNNAEATEEGVAQIHRRLCKYDLALAFDLSKH